MSISPKQRELGSDVVKLLDSSDVQQPETLGQGASTSLPMVTAVIPTRNRTDLVMRAIRSVTAQTYKNLEIVVVVDGPDPETVSALHQLSVPKLRIVKLETSVGGSEARNTGVRNASGEWIALLDDDDEWLPSKIEDQIAFALQLPAAAEAVISCKFIWRSGECERILPLRSPGKIERIDEYICRPIGWGQGDGFLQTSTWLISRTLLLRVPFVLGLRRGQDFVWLLEACNRANAQVFVVPRVLSIFNATLGAGVTRISRMPDWRSLHSWVKQNRDCFSPESYSYYFAQILLPDVCNCRESLRVRIQLLLESVKDGSPTAKCLALFIGRAFMPSALRSAGRMILDRAISMHIRRIRRSEA